MTIGGWITMTLSIGLVTILFLWCIYKIITTPGETERMHGFDLAPEEDFWRRKGRANKRKNRKRSFN